MQDKLIALMIFDLDGTIIDSKKDIALCVNKSFRAFGLPELPDELIAKHVGYGVKPLFDNLSSAHPQVDASEVFNLFQSLYDKHLLDHTRPYEHVTSLLEACHSTLKVVLTNKRQAAADKIIDGLNLRKDFAGVFGPEIFGVRKPDPQSVLKICEQFKIPVEKAIMIGDTEADVLAGKRAGAQTCAVTYGYGNAQLLQSLNPDYLFSSVEQMSTAFLTVVKM